MEKTTQEAQTPQRIVDTPDPGMCTTCISGTDPYVTTALFQEALQDAR